MARQFVASTTTALLLCLVVAGGPGCAGRASSPAVGFWYDTPSPSLPVDIAASVGGPLSGAELAASEHQARAELEHAFAGLTLAITDRHDAFWRVRVVDALPVRYPQQLPSAGESVALGPLGGAGGVDFEVVARKAVMFAPAGSSRQMLLDAIARGIGRTAVHEIMHQMLGGSVRDNRDDAASYEFHSADRAEQFYGELHWTTARPLLEQKFPRR